MASTRVWLQRKSEKYHEIIHLIFGLFAYLMVLSIDPHLSINNLYLALANSILPDVDHLFSMLIYARETPYAVKCRHYLSNFQFSKFAHFCAAHHKDNNFILSHNLGFMSLVYVVYVIALFQSHYSVAVFFLAWFMHFVYDLLEDLLYFSHMNPCWLLKFKLNLNTYNED